MADANTTLIYSWDIKGLKVQNTSNLANVIVHTTFEVKGTDANNNSGTFSGAMPLTPPANTATFIPFSQLQANTVISWIEAEIANNSTYQAHIKERIIDQINLIESPVTDVGSNLPWANTSNTTSTTTAL